MFGIPNIYFDESGDSGDPNKGSRFKYFVVAGVYVPNYSYQMCVKSIQKLLGPSIAVTPANEVKACWAKPSVQVAVLQELVNYDCQFGIVQINKSMAKDYSSLYNMSPRGKNIRTNMILSVLQSTIKSERIKHGITVHIDRFPSTNKVRRDLSKYLDTNTKKEFGVASYVFHPHSHDCLGVRGADHVCNAMFKKAERNDNQMYNVIANNISCWLEITDADFLIT
jgi:hypothetical protein